jgi:signal transduction histidine kinase
MAMNARLEAEVAAAMERHRIAEAALAHAQKMEALGQLAGGVAHDFNNAAAAVLAGLQLLERRHGEAVRALGPEAHRLVSGIREAAGRGGAVAHRLLGFARRERLEPAELDAAELLEGLREVLATTLGAGVRVRTEVSPGGLRLFADKALLETTLINLAVNARDAMPEGGEVVLGAAAARPGERPPGGLGRGPWLRLYVADTGEGMDAATLARATEPFFTTKPTGKGTGLGLPMAQGFATRSGGALHIASAPGRGTVVTLWLPQAG